MLQSTRRVSLPFRIDREVKASIRGTITLSLQIDKNDLQEGREGLVKINEHQMDTPHRKEDNLNSIAVDFKTLAFFVFLPWWSKLCTFQGNPYSRDVRQYNMLKFDMLETYLIFLLRHRD